MSLADTGAPGCRIALKKGKAGCTQLDFGETELNAQFLAVVPLRGQPDFFQPDPHGFARPGFEAGALAIAGNPYIMIGDATLAVAHLQLAPELVTIEQVQVTIAQAYRCTEVISALAAWQGSHGHHRHDLVPLNVMLGLARCCAQFVMQR
ncbi:hypothetical protein N5I19_16790 [Pseudomonas chengduensis]|uniref:hypothetical protein n=1 Tax=Ectopseudomonas chengduensis TaxID=489632 RepID=UPI0011BDFE8B|nr:MULTISPECIES: hypothetical protein [Pseudomonas]MBP3059631.1 hypothetical protein [Pseudomonas chengduensis]MDH1560614.1 hypothetical protein [Pseudomonas chengduensis]MDI6006422.1 hypothetical protein [Pseudomonas sp. MDMC17]NNB73353.1 hypothetical protein [Pseudomonas chengduensis]